MFDLAKSGLNFLSHSSLKAGLTVLYVWCVQFDNQNRTSNLDVNNLHELMQSKCMPEQGSSRGSSVKRVRGNNSKK